MASLVASSSGCSSRGARSAAMGDRSSVRRALIIALSACTGRVACCTTSHTTNAITASSAAWRARVDNSSWRARLWRSSRVSATWIVAMPNPTWLVTGCSSTATRTGSPW